MEKSSEGYGFADAMWFEHLLTTYVRMSRMTVDMLTQKQPDENRKAGFESEILCLLMGAQAVWLTSGLRYWKQMGEILARHGMGLIEVAAGPDAARDDGTLSSARQRLMVIDKARAYLREVADTSVSEAEAFSRQLLEIEAALRKTQDPGPEPEGKRRARVKR